MQKQYPPGNGSDPDEDGRFGKQRKPSFRTAQKAEKIAPQKWVQCAKCELWRKVASHLHKIPSMLLDLHV